MRRRALRTWFWILAAGLVALAWSGGTARADDGPPGKGKRVGHERHRGKGHDIGRGRGHEGHAGGGDHAAAPELDPGAAGGALLLLGGGLAVVLERRRRAA